MNTKRIDYGNDGRVVLLEDVGDEDEGKVTAVAVKWSWDSEVIRTARTKGTTPALLIDFGDGPLSHDELARLDATLGRGRVQQVCDEPATHAPWQQVWENIPE